MIRSTYKLSSDCQKLALALRKNLQCPVNRGVTVKITKDEFVRLCKWHCRNRHNNSTGTNGINQCDVCKLKENIFSGLKYKPPHGIKFFTKREYTSLVRSLTPEKPFAQPGA
jgi:hypothetical protein